MEEENTIIEKLEFIRDEKVNKVIPENIKAGVNILNVEGTLNPTEDLEAELSAQEALIQQLKTALENKTSGGGGEPNIFVQLEEPEKKKGIWLQKEAEPEHYIYDNNVYTSAQWLSNTPTMPYSFNQSCATAVGNNIYLFGSETSSYNKYAYKFDTSTSTFTKLSNIPKAFYRCGIATVGTDIYLVGGNNNSRIMQKYDTLTDTYTELSSGEYTYDWCKATAVGTDIYITGKLSVGANISKLIKYDTLTDTYTDITPNNFTSNTNYSIASEGNTVWLMGSPTNSSNASYLYAYDINTGILTFERSFENLLNGDITICNGVLYAAGGNSNTSAGNSKHFQTYNLTTKEYHWSNHSQEDIYLVIPYPAPNAGVTSVNGSVYVFGGNTYPTRVQIFMAGSKQYDYDNSVVVDQSASTYSIELYNNSKDVISPTYKFTNAWYYTLQDGLETNIPTYYGDGTQWVKFKN